MRARRGRLFRTPRATPPVHRRTSGMNLTSFARRALARVSSGRRSVGLGLALSVVGCTVDVPGRDPEALPDATADASNRAPESDATPEVDAASVAPEGGASVELVTVASGTLPAPLVARRLTYVHHAPCEASEAVSSPLTQQSACCFTDRPEAVGVPVRITVRRRAATELTCLDAGEGTPSACAPVDPSGKATFANGMALQVLYSHWGLLYSALVSDTSLAVRLSSVRDHATVELAVYGRFFVGPGCASGAGSYVPPTRLDVPLSATKPIQGSE